MIVSHLAFVIAIGAGGFFNPLTASFFVLKFCPKLDVLILGDGVPIFSHPSLEFCQSTTNNLICHRRSQHYHHCQPGHRDKCEIDHRLGLMSCTVVADLQDTSSINDTPPNLLWDNLCRPQSRLFVDRVDFHSNQLVLRGAVQLLRFTSATLGSW
ncbi:hypothetical protein PGTUg99_026285 [Puccinia graminis f. sp. tritici]|uniref:Uncharacterized protein n=1 Tax=Puccinia graminis f. sp. tritici TaxID=56615 RepID=A0A5B0PN20_PUCGR|nr:hypothetical protein PGTUg99_026285 [Puccinia graminis f. sp. tritici]